MDKHTISTIVWALFLIAFGLSCWSLVKAHTRGVVTRSSPGSFKYRRISRDQDPSGFQRYMIGLVIINIVFVIVLLVWGSALFFW